MFRRVLSKRLQNYLSEVYMKTNARKVLICAILTLAAATAYGEEIKVGGGGASISAILLP